MAAPKKATHKAKQPAAAKAPPAKRARRKPAPKYQTMGPVVEAFLETAIVQTKGQWNGQPLVLEPWQRDFLREAFLVDPKTGLRVYRTVTLGLPAKNGKSQLASGLSLYGLVADNVMGALEGAPQVYAAANAQDQARIVFDEARDAARQSPFLSRRLDIREHRILVPTRKGAIMRPLASDGKSIHGINPSFSVVDELGSAKDGQVLTILQKSRTARRQPFTMIISHVGLERFGPLGTMYDEFRAHPKIEVYGKKKGEHLLQIVRDRENRQLFWWYGLQDGYDPEDPDVWMKCNPASWQTIDTLQEQRNDNSLSWTEFQRYHLNAFTHSDDEFLPAGAFVACADEEMVIPRGAPVWLGIDAARKNDAGAVVVVHPQIQPDGAIKMMVVAYVLEADESDDTMLERLEMLVRKIGKRWHVREAHYDPWAFPRSADILASEGFEMVEFPQTHSRMVPATKLFRQHVLENHLVYDGDPILTRHVGNSVVKETERGYRIDKGKARHKVDGAVAAVMAVTAAHNAVTRGDHGRRQGVQIVGLS